MEPGLAAVQLTEIHHPAAPEAGSIRVLKLISSAAL
jgi:hypothetical protein